MVAFLPICSYLIDSCWLFQATSVQWNLERFSYMHGGRILHPGHLEPPRKPYRSKRRVAFRGQSPASLKKFRLKPLEDWQTSFSGQLRENQPTQLAYGCKVDSEARSTTLQNEVIAGEWKSGAHHILPTNQLSVVKCAFNRVTVSLTDRDNSLTLITLTPQKSLTLVSLVQCNCSKLGCT